MLSKFINDISSYFEKMADVLSNRTKDVLIGFGGLAVMYALMGAITLILSMILGFSFPSAVGSFHSGLLGVAGKANPSLSLALTMLIVLLPLILIWFLGDVIGRSIFSAYIVPPFFDKTPDNSRILPTIIYLVLNSLLFFLITVVLALFFGSIIFIGHKFLHLGIFFILFVVAVALLVGFLLMPLSDYVFAGIGEVLLEAAEPVQTFLSRLSSLATLSGDVFTKLVRFLLLRLLLMAIGMVLSAILSLPIMLFALIPLVGGAFNFTMQLLLLAINAFLYTTALVYVDRS